MRHYELLALKLKLLPRRGDQGVRSHAQKVPKSCLTPSIQVIYLLITHLALGLSFWIFCHFECFKSSSFFFFLTILSALLHLVPQVNFGLLLIVFSAFTLLVPQVCSIIATISKLLLLFKVPQDLIWLKHKICLVNLFRVWGVCMGTHDNHIFNICCNAWVKFYLFLLPWLIPWLELGFRFYPSTLGSL